MGSPVDRALAHARTYRLGSSRARRGKGSISKRLIRDFDFFHLSTGDLLREQARLFEVAQ